MMQGKRTKPEHRQGDPDPGEHWAFSDGASGLLFNRQSMRLFPVAPDVAQTLDAILRQLDQVLPGSPEAAAVAEILAAFNAQALPNPLEGLLALGLPPAAGSAPEPVASKPVASKPAALKPLGKLALNVANDCNLACSYCYANKGTYGTPDRSLLLPDDAERYVERLAARFDRIDTVQFMGGEPSMNPAAIRRVGT